ncbi:50S ribosomal protein L29 [Leptothermofonsia sichuanensis E412]|uniref:50S ribosomal protein L29 n=1 Tax=Leptothermofonsia sichuanensis TaxID=2917832 RepID=UPI001CA70F87|nr:50S ribosomal protein L29 [Leptothermofonsia sichuanensis]QZZ19221.1 50S ribosomal protein L29 [Leptothermofonsia sichuanensis E412]
MPLPKIEDARSLSDKELQEQIVAVKRELFQLRFQKGTRQLEKSHQFKHNRHRLAQLMTVERERQLASIVSDAETE